jgi:hypothetical protein
MYATFLAPQPPSPFSKQGSFKWGDFFHGGWHFLLPFVFSACAHLTPSTRCLGTCLACTALSACAEAGHLHPPVAPRRIDRSRVSLPLPPFLLARARALPYARIRVPSAHIRLPSRPSGHLTSYILLLLLLLLLLSRLVLIHLPSTCTHTHTHTHTRADPSPLGEVRAPSTPAASGSWKWVSWVLDVCV